MSVSLLQLTCFQRLMQCRKLVSLTNQMIVAALHFCRIFYFGFLWLKINNIIAYLLARSFGCFCDLLFPPRSRFVSVSAQRTEVTISVSAHLHESSLLYFLVADAGAFLKSSTNLCQAFWAAPWLAYTGH